MPPPTTRIGTTVAGRYRLEQLLGQGGMGEVYVAVQQPLGRKVALKLIRTTLRDHGAAASRFEREARSLASLAHPNIVTLFDFGRTEASSGPGGTIGDDDSEMYMVMELLPGESLRRRLETHGRLPPQQALSLVADVCRALEAAHRAGIVHRDLKPDNVMLVDLSRSGGPVDVVKVLDFGIARLADDTEPAPAAGAADASAPRPRHITQTGHIVGTPGYIAPEMFTEGVLDDPRSDLYAVGVLTWELLTNAALFSAPTPVMLMMKHAQERPPTLAQTFPATDGVAGPHPALDAFLANLLHKDRTRRFSSAAAVVDAIAALPTAALLPFGKTRRAFAVAGGAAAVVGAGVGAGVGAVVGAGVGAGGAPLAAATLVQGSGPPPAGPGAPAPVSSSLDPAAPTMAESRAGPLLSPTPPPTPPPSAPPPSSSSPSSPPSSPPARPVVDAGAPTLISARSSAETAVTDLSMKVAPLSSLAPPPSPAVSSPPSSAAASAGASSTVRMAALAGVVLVAIAVAAWMSRTADPGVVVVAPSVPVLPVAGPTAPPPPPAMSTPVPPTPTPTKTTPTPTPTNSTNPTNPTKKLRPLRPSPPVKTKPPVTHVPDLSD